MKVEDCDLEQYKKDMQEAFQKGFEEEFGKTEEVILPRKDVDKALQTKGSIAYKAVVDGNEGMFRLQKVMYSLNLMIR